MYFKIRRRNLETLKIFPSQIWFLLINTLWFGQAWLWFLAKQFTNFLWAQLFWYAIHLRVHISDVNSEKFRPEGCARSQYNNVIVTRCAKREKSIMYVSKVNVHFHLRYRIKSHASRLIQSIIRRSSLNNNRCDLLYKMRFRIFKLLKSESCGQKSHIETLDSNLHQYLQFNVE